MRSSSRWMTLGGAILGAGVLIWITWGVLRPSGQHFWSWIGVLGVGLTAIGVVFLIMGFVMRDEQEKKLEEPVRQSLKSGSRSINLQAHGDINFGDSRGPSKDKEK